MCSYARVGCLQVLMVLTACGSGTPGPTGSTEPGADLPSVYEVALSERWQQLEEELTNPNLDDHTRLVKLMNFLEHFPDDNPHHTAVSEQIAGLRRSIDEEEYRNSQFTDDEREQNEAREAAQREELAQEAAALLATTGDLSKKLAALKKFLWDHPNGDNIRAHKIRKAIAAIESDLAEH